MCFLPWYQVINIVIDLDIWLEWALRYIFLRLMLFRVVCIRCKKMTQLFFFIFGFQKYSFSTWNDQHYANMSDDRDCEAGTHFHVNKIIAVGREMK